MTTAEQILARLAESPATEGRIVYDLQLPTMTVRIALTQLAEKGVIGRWGETRKLFALREQRAAA